MPLPEKFELWPRFLRRRKAPAAPVTAVVFDVGRVLYRWDLRHLFEKLVSDPAELEYVVTHVITIDWHTRHDAGEDLAALVAERKAVFPRYAELIDAYASRFSETIPGPVPGSLELVQRLDEAGVPLFAITNFASVFWDDFRRTAPVFDRFRDIVVSGVEQLAKPDPGIFRLAESRFGIVPGQTLFVDDNAHNIAAARARGWQVHHFSDAERLEADLRGRALLS